MFDGLLQPAFVLLWSSGYVVGALAIEVASPVPLLATRFVLASLVAVPLALRRGWPRGVSLHRLVLIGLLLQVTQFGGIYGGLALGVPAGLSALMMLGLSPLVTTGLAIATGQESSDWRVWAGLVTGLAGVVIGLAPELDQASIGLGVALTVVGMLGLAGGTVLQKRWATGVDPLVSAAVQSLTGAVVMVPVLAVVGGRYDVGVRLALSVGWLGWGMGIGTLLVLLTLLRRLHASRVGAMLLLVPAVTALASAPALGEPLHAAALLGMAVSAAGVGIALRAPLARGERAAPTGVAARTDAARTGAAIGGRPGADAPACERAPTSAPPANDASPATTAGTRTQRGMASVNHRARTETGGSPRPKAKGGPWAPLPKKIRASGD